MARRIRDWRSSRAGWRFRRSFRPLAPIGELPPDQWAAQARKGQLADAQFAQVMADVLQAAADMGAVQFAVGTAVVDGVQVLDVQHLGERAGRGANDGGQLLGVRNFRRRQFDGERCQVVSHGVVGFQCLANAQQSVGPL